MKIKKTYICEWDYMLFEQWILYVQKEIKEF